MITDLGEHFHYRYRVQHDGANYYHRSRHAAEALLARLRGEAAATPVAGQPPFGAERSVPMNTGDLITNGAAQAVVVAVSEAFVIARPTEGGDEFVIAAESDWTLVPTTPAPLSVARKFVVYSADGERVDGYKYESRARRNNDARFAGSGYWLGTVKESDFTWVPA